MLTIFTTPKPFSGHNRVIQTNAIRSWLFLRPECEVILFGNEEGTAEVAYEFGTRHIPDVDCNEYGTPLVNSLFSAAQNLASHELICYVNADIILMSDFMKAVRQVQGRPSLIVGRRWDIDLEEPLDFSNPDWETYLRACIAEGGKLHPATGIDYFVFPRRLYNDVPQFAIGRGGWDNWLVYQACRLKVPVIDATKAITAIHQNHDYSHHPEGMVGIWQGPEMKRNIELTGGVNHCFTINYATLFLTPQGLRPALTPRYLYFRLRAIPMLYSYVHFLLLPFRVFEKFLAAIRLITRFGTYWRTRSKRPTW